MRGQSLQINFLVKFILSIVIFSLGIILVWKIYSDGTSTINIPQTEIDRRIQALNCQPTELICIGADTLKTGGGKNILVDVTLFNNYNDNKNYVMTLQLRNATTDQPLDGESVNIELLPVLYQMEIRPKSKGEFSFIIKTSKTTPKGFYVVRVGVQPSGGTMITRRVNIEIA
jgi:hypothetical protein